MKIGFFDFGGFWLILLLSCLVVGLFACIWLIGKSTKQLDRKGYNDDKVIHWIVGLFIPFGIGIVCLALLAISSPDKNAAKEVNPAQGPVNLPKL